MSSAICRHNVRQTDVTLRAYQVVLAHEVNGIEYRSQHLEHVVDNISFQILDKTGSFKFAFGQNKHINDNKTNLLKFRLGIVL